MTEGKAWAALRPVDHPELCHCGAGVETDQNSCPAVTEGRALAVLGPVDHP